MAGLDIEIPKLKLNDGNEIPMLGYGTGTAWYKSGDESKLDQGVIDAVKTAIRLGYYHLDGAEMYKTETELGIAISESKVPRDQLFITTKLNTNIENIESALRTSLEKLKLEYVDLYLIHSPFVFNSPAQIQKAWKDMEALKTAGLAKSIGVSNFRVEDLKALFETATVPPAVNQIEFHPYLQQPELLQFHKEKGIVTCAYAPLTPATKAKPGPLDGVLEVLAKKYAVSEAEVCLRWCVEQDVVPITTSAKEQRLSDLLRVWRMSLTGREVDEIREVGGEKHFRGFWVKNFGEGK